MAFTTADKKAWIKRIYRKSVENGVPFKDQIETDLDTAVDAVAGGEIQSVSGNGLATTFAVSGGAINGISPTDAKRLLNSVDDLYDAAVSDLASRSTPISSPTDEQIRAAMLTLCVPKYSMTADFTSLRCP